VLLKDTVAAADENLSDAVAELEEMMGITEAASVRIYKEVSGRLCALRLHLGGDECGADHAYSIKLVRYCSGYIVAVETNNSL